MPGSGGLLKLPLQSAAPDSTSALHTHATFFPTLLLGKEAYVIRYLVFWFLKSLKGRGLAFPLNTVGKHSGLVLLEVSFFSLLLNVSTGQQLTLNLRIIIAEVTRRYSG